MMETTFPTANLNQTLLLLPPQTASVPDLITDDELNLILKFLMAHRFFMSFAGIFTNTLNVQVFVRMGIEDSVTMGFFSLSCLDLLCSLLSLAYAIARVLLFIVQDYNVWMRISPFYISIYIILFQNAVYQLSMLITAFLAIQRSLCVLLPMRFKGMFTRSRTFIILTAIFVFTMGFYMTFTSRFQMTEITDATTNSSVVILTLGAGFKQLSLFLNVGLCVVFNIICQMGIFACVCIMRHVLTKSLSFRQMSSAQKSTKIGNCPDQSTNSKVKILSNTKERTAIMQVTVVCIVFLVTNIPNTLLAAIHVIYPHFSIHANYPNTSSLCNNVRAAIEMFNPCANFFIYYRYNSNFRKHFFFRRSTSKPSKG